MRTEVAPKHEAVFTNLRHLFERIDFVRERVVNLRSLPYDTESTVFAEKCEQILNEARVLLLHQNPHSDAFAAQVNVPNPPSAFTSLSEGMTTLFDTYDSGSGELSPQDAIFYTFWDRLNNMLKGLMINNYTVHRINHLPEDKRKNAVLEILRLQRIIPNSTSLSSFHIVFPDSFTIALYFENDQWNSVFPFDSAGVKGKYVPKLPFCFIRGQDADGTTLQHERMHLLTSELIPDRSWKNYEAYIETVLGNLGQITHNNAKDILRPAIERLVDGHHFEFLGDCEKLIDNRLKDNSTSTSAPILSRQSMASLAEVEEKFQQVISNFSTIRSQANVVKTYLSNRHGVLGSAILVAYQRKFIAAIEGLFRAVVLINEATDMNQQQLRDELIILTALLQPHQYKQIDVCLKKRIHDLRKSLSNV